MKILVSIQLFGILIFSNFDGLNGADNPESSSGLVGKRGGYRPGAGRPFGGARGKFRPGECHIERIPRQPDLVIKFMEHDVSLWLADDEVKVIQADFLGNRLPNGAAFYRTNNFLVRLSSIGGYTAVVYITQGGNLLGVRAPKHTYANIMEPNEKTWFIVYARKYFRVKVHPVTSEVEGIELATGNVHRPYDTHEEVIFPWIKFYVFRGQPLSKVTGAALHV